MRDGRIDVQSFASDALLFLLRKKFNSAHVVQAIGEFDDNNADVMHHGGSILRTFRPGALREQAC